MPYRKTDDRVRHSQQVKRRIVEAALAIIVERGLEHLSIRGVVSVAGTSTGNYYFHFENKEALLLAVVEELAARASQRIDSVARDAPDEPQRLAGMVYTGVRSILADRRLGAALFSGAHGAKVRERIVDLFVGRTARYFAARASSGIGHPKVGPDVIAGLWQGAIMLTVERVLSGALEVSDDEAATACARWNLAAVGFDTAVIDQAVDVARERYARDRIRAGGATGPRDPFAPASSAP